MTVKIHAAAGAVALIMILCFWTATVLSELSGTQDTVRTVKTAVLYGMAVLVPAMVTAAGTGTALGRGWKLPQVAAKARRMRLIAANGVVILVPSAVFLAMRAQAGTFGVDFYTVQAVELAAGAVNAALLSLNLRDGLALARRRTRPAH